MLAANYTSIGASVKSVKINDFCLENLVALHMLFGSKLERPSEFSRQMLRAYDGYWRGEYGLATGRHQTVW